MKALIIEDADRWQRILDRLTYDVYHMYDYAQMSAEQEKGKAILFVAEEGDSVLCLPLIIKPVALILDRQLNDAASPYGYPGPLMYTQDSESQNDFTLASLKALRDYCQSNNIISVFTRFHPILAPVLDAYNRIGTLIAHGETVSINLTFEEEEIWRQYRRNHRAGINKLRRSSAVVLVDQDWDYYSEFLDLYTETMIRHSAAEQYFFSVQYFNDLRKVLGQHLCLCVVKINEQVACAGMFTEINGIVQYHLGGTKNDFKKYAPNKLMVDYMRRWSKERGNKILHLGGGVGAQKDSLFHFKAGFSSVRHNFYTWRMVIDDRLYTAMTRQWESMHNCKADAREGFFPAYRKN